MSNSWYSGAKEFLPRNLSVSRSAFDGIFKEIDNLLDSPEVLKILPKSLKCGSKSVNSIGAVKFLVEPKKVAISLYKVNSSLVDVFIVSQISENFKSFKTTFKVRYVKDGQVKESILVSGVSDFYLKVTKSLEFLKEAYFKVPQLKEQFNQGYEVSYKLVFRDESDFYLILGWVGGRYENSKLVHSFIGDTNTIMWGIEAHIENHLKKG